MAAVPTVTQTVVVTDETSNKEINPANYGAGDVLELQCSNCWLTQNSTMAASLVIHELMINGVNNDRSYTFTGDWYSPDTLADGFDGDFKYIQTTDTGTSRNSSFIFNNDTTNFTGALYFCDNLTGSVRLGGNTGTGALTAAQATVDVTGAALGDATTQIIGNASVTAKNLTVSGGKEVKFAGEVGVSNAFTLQSGTATFQSAASLGAVTVNKGLLTAGGKALINANDLTVSSISLTGYEGLSGEYKFIQTTNDSAEALLDKVDSAYADRIILTNTNGLVTLSVSAGGTILQSIRNVEWNAEAGDGYDLFRGGELKVGDGSGGMGNAAYASRIDLGDIVVREGGKLNLHATASRADASHDVMNIGQRDSRIYVDSAIDLRGGELCVSDGCYNFKSIKVTNDSVLYSQWNKFYDIESLTGSGDLKVNSSSWGAGYYGTHMAMHLGNANTSYTGNITMNCGIQTMNYLILSHEQALVNSVVTLTNDYNVLSLDNAAIALKGLAGNGGVVELCGLQGNAGVTASTLTLDVEEDAIFSGRVNAGISIVKKGVASQTIRNLESSASSTLNVQEGTLFVNKWIGGGDVTVAADATLQLVESGVLSSGAVVLDGKVILERTSLTPTSESTFSDGDNGFLVEGSLVLASGTSVAVGDSFVLQLGSTTYGKSDLTLSGTEASLAVTGSTYYYVNEGNSVTYNADRMGTATDFIMLSGSAFHTADGSILNKVKRRDNSSTIFLTNSAGDDYIKLVGDFNNVAWNITQQDGVITMGDNSSFNGNVTILSGATVKNSAANAFGADYNADSSNSVTLERGATLIAGGNDLYHKLVMQAGSVLKSEAGDRGEGIKQNPYIILQGNAEINVSGTGTVMGMRRQDNGNLSKEQLQLDGHTLTKTGAGEFFIYDGNISRGTIDVQDGIFWMKRNTACGDTHFIVRDGATLKRNGSSTNFKSLTTYGNATMWVDGVEFRPNEASANYGCLTKTGSGSLIYKTTVSFADGLNVAEGIVAFEQAVTLDGMISVAAGATLDVRNNAVITVETLAGFVDRAASPIPTVNGFVDSGDSYKIVDKAEGATVTGLISVNYGNGTYAVDDVTGCITLDSAKIYYAVEAGKVVTEGSEATTGATEYYVGGTAVLEYAGITANKLSAKNVSGDGIIRVTFDRSGHGEYVEAGQGFTGTVEVNGYMNLKDFRMNKDATIKLGSGQHWSGGGASINYDILLSDTEGAYVFRNSGTDTIAGVVSGKYLDIANASDVNQSGKLRLTNSANQIENVNIGPVVGTNSSELIVGADMAFGKVIAAPERAKVSLENNVTMTLGDNKNALVSTIPTLAVSNQGNKINVTSNAALALRTVEGSGMLTKSGAGTLTLTGSEGTMGLTGGLSVIEGKVATSGAVTLGGVLNLGNGVSLDVSAGALTLAGDGGAALSLGKNLVLNAGTLDSTDTVLISGVSSLVGYGGEVAANTYFSSIVGIDDLAGYVVKLENGNLVLSESSAEPSNLYWEGENANWGSEGWSEVDDQTTTLIGFTSGANVYFTNTDSTVTVAENVTVGAMTVSGADYIFNGNGVISANGLEIGTGATASFTYGKLNVGTLSELTVDGTMKLVGTNAISSNDLTSLVKLATGAGRLEVKGHSGDPDACMIAMGDTALTQGIGTLYIDGFYGISGSNVADTTTSYTIGAGKTMEVAADKCVRIQQGAKLVLDGGSLTGKSADSYIQMGGDGSPVDNAYGHIEIKNGGTLSIGYIENKGGGLKNTFSMSGGVLELTGASKSISGISTTITGGTIQTGDNSWSIIGTQTEGVYSVSIGGATIANSQVTDASAEGGTRAGNGTITLDTVKLTSALNVTGKVNFAGSITLAQDYTPTAESVSRYNDANGNSSTSGYKVVDMKYTLTTAAGTITAATDTTWSALTSSGTLTDGVFSSTDKTVTFAAAETTEYWVRDDEDASTPVDVTYDKTEDEFDAATKLVVDGGVLKLTTGLGGKLVGTGGDGIVLNGSGTIDLAGTGVTLQANQVSKAQGASGTTYLTGTGVYDLGTVTNLGTGEGNSAADLLKVTLGEATWAGTVKLSGTVAGVDLDDLAATNSVVELAGVSGSVTTGETGAAMRLAGAGFTMSEAEAETYTFTGAVTGSGDMTFALPTNETTVVLAGNLSAWKGGMVLAQSNLEGAGTPAFNLQLTGGGTILDAAANNGVVMNRGGIMKLTIGNTTTATTMRGTITNKGAGTLNLITQGNTTLEQALGNTGTGSLNLSNSGELTLKKDTTLNSLASSSSITATDQNLTVTGGLSGIAPSEGATPVCGSITAKSLTLQGASNTVGDLTLTGALTLGTAEAVSRLDAGKLKVGAVTLLNVDSAVKDQPYTSIIAATSLSQSMVITMSDALLKSKLAEAAEKTITLLTLETALADGTTVTLAGLTEDAAAAATQISVDGTTSYTLGWDTDKKVLTLTAELLGSGWKGLDGVDEADNVDLALWSEATSWSDAAVPTKETIVKLDGSAGGQQTIWMEGTGNAAKTLTVDHLSGYTLLGVDSTAENKLTIEEKLTVNRGTLNLRGVDVEVKGNLELNSDAASVQNWQGNQLSIGGNLANNGTIYNADSATLKVTGDVTNIGNITNDGSIEVTGGVTNTGTIALQKGTTTITGAVDNDDRIEVTGGSVTIGIDGTAADTTSVDNSGSIVIGGEGTQASMTVNGSLKNTNGTITIDEDGSLKVNGNLDNTNGSITIGTASVKDNPDTPENEAVAATTGSLTVTGSLTHSGSKDKLVVNEESSLSVGGNLNATAMELKFGGDVTVGGTATVDRLTIADTATFIAKEADIGTLTNDGALTVGTLKVDAEGNAILDAYGNEQYEGGSLVIDSLSGHGNVTVGEGGRLNIVNSTNFKGELDNKGSIVVTDQEGVVTLSTKTDNGGIIVAPKLTISGIWVKDGEIVDPGTEGATLQTANGSKLTSLTTNTLVFENLETTATTPVLSTGGLAVNTTDTDGKITIVLSEVENSSVNSTGTTHLLSIENAMPGTVADNFDLSRYGYVVNADNELEYDKNSDAVKKTYMQNLLAKGLIVRFSDTDPTSDIALLALGGVTDLYGAVDNQTLAESTWTIEKDAGTGNLMNATGSGLVVIKDSSTADGIVLKNASILDNVRQVEVKTDATIDLTGLSTTQQVPSAADPSIMETVAVPVQINGLSGSANLTVKNTDQDTIDYVKISDVYTRDGSTSKQNGAYTGTLSLSGKLDATLDLKGDKVAAASDVVLGGKLTNGSLSVAINKLGDDAVADASNLSISNTKLNIAYNDGGATVMDTTNVADKGHVLVDLGAMKGTANGIFIGQNNTSSVLVDKYFTNFRFDKTEGAVVADRNTTYYSDSAGKGELSKNGSAGLELASAALAELNPQSSNPDGGLSKMLTALDAAIAAGNTSSMDELGAALAGASNAVLGMAAHGDLDRQVQAIRNRTTTMGVDQSVVHDDMPYFNAWINAEGNFSEMSDSETAGGYKLNSWGGTVGFDVDFTPTFTAGMALTAMYGDLSVTGVDQASGDLNSYYVSAFARYCASAWTHTFVATVGLTDISMKRTVMGEDIDSTTDGMGFALMYEVGHVFALDEDATACLQPIFNITWRHTSVNGYDEKGSDLALKVGNQTLDTVTLGLGARMQAVVGESMYNRTSIFEARVLAKFDIGDRRSTTDVQLAGAKAEIESAERGAIGLEAGAGLTIPLGDDGGNLFMDAAVELRADYMNVNGTVGYRINF